MKKNLWYVLLAGAFVVLLVLAGTLYGLLSEDFQPQTDTLLGGSSESSEIASETVSQDESSASQAESQAEQTAQTAPDFTVYDMNGEAVKLSDKFGKPIVVNFWATWCGPCKAEMPAFQSIYEKYGDKVEFMMVNMTDGSRETVSGVQSFMDSSRYTFPVYCDTQLEAAITYGVSSIPRTLFIYADGTPYGVYTSALSEEYLETFIGEIINETQKGKE